MLVLRVFVVALVWVGTFGAVYLGKNKITGEEVAIKKISKQHTDNVAFQREIEALLHVRDSGGHPNICGLQENFDENDYYYLVLDLVSGGEMFDQLCAEGAYSEADAARLLREVASALAFLHGIGIVHGDLKPENLLLSTAQKHNSVVKVCDFGCAQVNWSSTVVPHSNDYRQSNPYQALDKPATANTPAYTPPEVLKRSKRKTVIDPSFDMWALGVILYIMLTGVHPFDLYGNSTDEEIVHQIVSGKQPPFGKSPLTAHLSKDAIQVIKRLLARDPRKRLSAHELLNHPWIRGETARTSKMADSDKRLSAYRAIKTKLEARVFADMVEISDNLNANDVTKKTSLIERSFQKLNPDHRGYITTKTLRKLSNQHVDTNAELEDLSLSGFSDLLAENLQNKYFPKGHVIYKEGDEGNSMFFINSGHVEVYTKDGAKTVRHAGDCFGEGALLHPKKIRSASIRCVTPVHAIEIGREYFEKYMASDEGEYVGGCTMCCTTSVMLMFLSTQKKGAKLNLREKDKSRKRQRAKTILQLQQNMKEVHLNQGDFLFKKGDEGHELYIIEDGKVQVSIDDAVVLMLMSGEMAGEHSLIFGRPRNVDARCDSSQCKLLAMQRADFYRLLETHPLLRESVRDICLRREFQKAICARTGKAFPRQEDDLREAFDAVDSGKSGAIELRELRTIIKRFDPHFSEQEIREILSTLDLDQTGKIHWAEFKKMFGIKSDQ